MRRLLVLAAAWLGGGHLALGFVGDINAAGQPRRWALNPPDGRVPATSVNPATRAILYRLDGAGYSTTNAAAELDAIRGAFDQWQGMPGTVLRFEEGPPATGTTDIDNQDGFNTLFWTRSLFVNGGRSNLSGVLALTFVASYSDGNVILDADTVFNGVQFRWFTDFANPTTQGVFVEAIALHEIGHFLGLRHSPVGGATMLFVGDFGVNSQVGLAADEGTAARALYGTAQTLAAVGRIAGTVRAGGVPVFGAAVFAEDAWGNVAAGTVTRSNGVYELPGLVPGAYQVRATPLDPQFGANYLIRGEDIASTYRNAETGFLSSAEALASVTEGGVATADLEVARGEPSRVARVLRPAPTLANPAFNNKPVAVQPSGQTLYLGVLTAAALGPTTALEIPGDGLSVGPTELLPNVLGNLSLAAAPVTFSPDATPGLRSLRLRVGSESAWAHGFVEVLPPFPDVNGDGLDDRFQRRYWTRFTAPAAAPAADPDGDGFDNRWEAATGSIPTNALSAHFEVLSVRVTAEGARVRSQTAAGKQFRLLSRETVPGSAWVEVGGPVTASGPETEFVDPGATNHVRFYRVSLLP